MGGLVLLAFREISSSSESEDDDDVELLRRVEARDTGWGVELVLIGAGGGRYFALTRIFLRSSIGLGILSTSSGSIPCTNISFHSSLIIFTILSCCPGPAWHSSEIMIGPSPAPPSQHVPSAENECFATALQTSRKEISLVRVYPWNTCGSPSSPSHTSISIQRHPRFRTVS